MTGRQLCSCLSLSYVLARRSAPHSALARPCPTPALPVLRVTRARERTAGERGHRWCGGSSAWIYDAGGWSVAGRGRCPLAPREPLCSVSHSPSASHQMLQNPSETSHDLQKMDVDMFDRVFRMDGKLWNFLWDFTWIYCKTFEKR